MGAHVASRAEQRRAAAQAKDAWQDLAARAETREQEFTQALAEAKREKASAKPRLLASDAARWSASQHTASAAAAQYRALDPGDWRDVTGQVGSPPFSPAALAASGVTPPHSVLPPPCRSAT